MCRNQIKDYGEIIPSIRGCGMAPIFERRREMISAYHLVFES
jgi:hypothetical protein